MESSSVNSSYLDFAAAAAKDSAKFLSTHASNAASKLVNTSINAFFESSASSKPKISPNSSHREVPMEASESGSQGSLLEPPGGSSSEATAPKPAVKNLSSAFAQQQLPAPKAPKAPNVVVLDSKSRVAVRFLLKKSKSFFQELEVYLSKPKQSNMGKFNSFVSSLRSSFKSTLASSIPSSQIISRLSSTLMNCLREQKLPDCLRFLGLSFTSICNGKKSTYHKSVPSGAARAQPKCQTYLNPEKKPEMTSLDGFEFARPKLYQCEYQSCSAAFFQLAPYLKHIRRHVDAIQCEDCRKAFGSLKNLRRHRQTCRQRRLARQKLLANVH